MASSRQVLLLAAVACLTSLAFGTQWMVGDGGGWRAKFNETGWTDGKTFVVGDSLQFVYPKEKHTVIMVGKDAFAACDLSANLQLGNWTSGNDVVQLDKPGKVWFICNKPSHCDNGMKLVIDVVDGTVAPSPLPFPFPFPLPFPGTAPAPSPLFRWPLFPWGSAPAPAPASPAAAPPSAAVRNPVGSAVAAAAAAVVAAALAF
ncbi:unnamed protein product [Miscanthus lutarioriparius]|uniref:Phytocyanin domain-containing protein n=1 Tax=Miscanthus lutarioriparius TaxID=422564 RepID=A0A811NH34_9POAL|nr:unnamed protein product [Miscanthus lutarioriparius]